MEGQLAQPFRRDYLLAKALTSFFIAYLFLRGFAGIDEDSRSLTILRSWYYVGPFLGFLLMSAYLGAAVLIPAFQCTAMRFAHDSSPAFGLATLFGFILGWITGFAEFRTIGVLSVVYFWVGLLWVVGLYVDTLVGMWPFGARRESDPRIERPRSTPS